MKQGDTDRTPYALACEISREMELGLSGPQVEELASFLAGFHDQEETARDLYRLGRAGVREAVRKLRAA